MGVKPDWWIRDKAAREGMITPFSGRVDGQGIVSYGLQPAGYDARLHHVVKFLDWARGQGKPLDPLALNPALYFEKSAESDGTIVLPPHGYMVGRTVEYFRIPRSCVVRGAGKTTYSSVGLNLDVASIHPGWEGHLLLHISNTSPVPIVVRAGEGIIYLEFHEIDGPVERDYRELKAPRFQGTRSGVGPGVLQ